MKIGLDAGHGLKTAGKRTPDGIHEWELNDKVRDKVVEFLKGYNVEFVFTDNDEGDTDESLAYRVKKYIDANVDVFVSIHHNAYKGTWGDATGVEVYTDLNPTSKDIELANAIYKNLPNYTGLKGRGVKRENWYVINQNKIPAVLVEGGFMDNRNDYNIITSEKGQEAYARAVAEGLIEFLGLTKTSPGQQSVSTQENKKIDVKYQAYADKWYPDVINTTDHAGTKGKAISGFRGNTVGPEKEAGKLIYCVGLLNGRWLGEITDREKDKSGDDFAGILGNPIDRIMVRASKGTARVRVRLLGDNDFLPWVTGYNKNDDENGYAGIKGRKIDAIQVEIV